MVAIKLAPSKNLTISSKKRPTIPFHYYLHHLILVAEIFGCTCCLHLIFLYYDDAKFTSSLKRLAAVYGWLISLCLIFFQKAVSKKRHTIEGYLVYWYMLAVVFIFLNLMFSIKMTIDVYSSWKNIITITAVTSLVLYFPIGIAERISNSSIYYNVLDTTKPTKLQILFIILFFLIAEAFYIHRCYEELTPRTFFNSLLSYCPVINIASILILGQACIAYNSDKLEFWEEDTISGEVRYGVCSWDEKSGRWDYVETVPKNKEDPLNVKKVVPEPC